MGESQRRQLLFLEDGAARDGAAAQAFLCLHYIFVLLMMSMGTVSIP